MAWNIDKQFDFCYGHRVWNQQLDAKYSLDTCLACRHLHGHQGKIKVHLEAKELNNGMVEDFKSLNWFKQFVDNYFDHKFIFDINDPLLFSDELKWLADQTTEYKFEEVWTPHIWGKQTFYTINFDLLNRLLDDDIKNKKLTTEQAQAIFEKYEGIVLVEFVPTSENLCKFFLDVVEHYMAELADKKGFIIKSVEFWETPKSHCEFTYE
jgi:6-pyruvoyltetrahydropterin/6-carboxytetrahydropterin synthase